jgi:hypothetical protein
MRSSRQLSWASAPWEEVRETTDLLGPWLGPNQLDGETEVMALEEFQTSGLLCPYGAPRRNEPPVVLVHGIKGAPQDMKTLADALVELGAQPWFFLYYDVHRYIDRSGVVMAWALRQLADQFSDKAVIAAHSMGGIVARSAMNFLQQPNWFLDPNTEQYPGQGLPVSAGELSRIDLLTIDTPLHGFDGLPNIRVQHPVEASWVDMVVLGHLFRDLYEVEHPEHFHTGIIEARNNDSDDKPFTTRSFNELTFEELTWIIEYLAGRTDDSRSPMRLLAYLEALGTADAFREILPGLEQGASDGSLTPAELLEQLAGVIPLLSGTHSTVLDHPALPGLVARVL